MKKNEYIGQDMSQCLYKLYALYTSKKKHMLDEKINILFTIKFMDQDIFPVSYFDYIFSNCVEFYSYKIEVKSSNLQTFKKKKSSNL